MLKKENTNLFNNKSILVTGGTGTFGKQFLKFVLKKTNFRRIVLYSRDEFKHYQIQNEYKNHKKFNKIRFFVGDVRDYRRLNSALNGVDIVIHAAAMKHVPISERNPFECVHTNIIGAENVVRASIENKVDKIVVISTDKASAPVNLYGATKLASDKIFIAANNIIGKNKSKFSVVRYGNVLFSRGSVIPFFRNIILSGENTLPVTDERMTRFVITIEQGIDFVVKSLNLMVGGEIFIPKLKSTSIIDIVNAMGKGLKTKIVGLREGEKIHESLISSDDAINTYDFKDYFIIFPSIDKRIKSWVKKKSGKKVKKEFSYTSFNNPEKIKLTELSKLIKTKYENF